MKRPSEVKEELLSEAEDEEGVLLERIDGDEEEGEVR